VLAAPANVGMPLAERVSTVLGVPFHPACGSRGPERAAAGVAASTRRYKVFPQFFEPRKQWFQKTASVFV
jgi:hypothetical protein